MKHIELSFNQPLPSDKKLKGKTVNRKHVYYFQLPERFSEMTEKQLGEVLEIRVLPEAEVKKRQRLVMLFWGLTIADLDFIEAEKAWRLGNWFADFVAPDAYLTENPFPVLKHEGTVLHGPADFLGNCSFIEFAMADNYHSAFGNGRDKEMMLNLMAVLWRPSKSKKALNADDFDGDKRKPFHYQVAEERAKELNDLPYHILEGVLLFFNGFKRFLKNHERYGKLYEGNENSQPTEQGPWQLGQKLLIRTGTYSDLDRLQNDSLYNVLDFLIDLTERKDVVPTD